MNPLQWSQVKDRVEALWGKQTKWQQAATLTGDVLNLSFETAMSAVQDRLHDKYAPAPAEIIAACTATTPVTVTRMGPEDCSHPHWGIVEYLADGRRRGVCPVCYTEQLFPPGRLLTVGEMEERRLQSQTVEAY